jgi:hypothetical protein
MGSMISYLLPLPVGNAVQITVGDIPAGTTHWRILRNLTGAFPAWNDPNSVVVTDSNIGDPTQVIDAGPGLTNGLQVYYLPFFYNGGTETWTADTGGAQVCTPATTYVDESVDALTIVLNRVTLGIAAEIARQALTPVSGVIQVMSAPPVFSEELRWPVISVHMDNETPLNRALGESIGDDEFDTITQTWDNQEGWQAKTTISIVGWSINADERILLRKAIRRVIIANLAVFDAAGLLQIEFSQGDVENFDHNAPVYETVGTFTCVTPLAVNARQIPIDDVEVTVYPTFDGIVGAAVPSEMEDDLTDEFGNPLLTESGEPVALEI